MTYFSKHPPSHWLVAAGVLLACLALTAAAVVHQHQSNQAVAQIRFGQEVRASTDAIAQRVNSYSELVAGMRDLFIASPQLDGPLFEHIISARHLLQRYPEIRNISFARWVTHDQLPAFALRLAQQARDRGEVLSSAQEADIIHPELPGPNHYIIEYLWPFARNEGIWGLDIASQPANVASLLVARNTRQPAISAPFDLVQEQHQRSAFMVRYPVFDASRTLADQPPSFTGAIAAAVRVSEMLEAIQAASLLNGVALHLQDIGPKGTDQPATAQPLGEIGNAAAPDDRPALMAATRVLDVHNRRWRLEYAARGPMLSSAELALPYWIAAFGALVSLLLTVAAGRLMNQRLKALAQAENARVALHDREQKLRAVFHQAAVGVSIADLASGRFLNVNQKFCEITGYTKDELLQMGVGDVSNPEDQLANMTLMRQLQRGEIPSYRIEKRLRRKDGQEIWIDLTASAIHEAGKAPSQNIGVIQDITEQRQMKEELQRGAERQLAMLNHLPTGILLSGIDDRIEYRNDAFLHITGYTEEIVHDSGSWFLNAYPDPAARLQVQNRWRKLHDEALAGNGFIQAHEYVIRRADGQWRTVEISGVIMDKMEMILLDDLTDRKTAENEISYLASYDRLTGVANREFLHVQLQDILRRCRASGHFGALLMLDLDHFKNLNETRGHSQGDEVLRQTAQRLQGFVQGHGMVARHGDDAFVFVLESLCTDRTQMQETASALGARLLAALAEPFMLDAEPYHTSASIGAAVFGGDDASAHDLLQQVDMAMYDAKAAGRNTLRFYNRALQERMQARAAMERDLRLAIEQEQFELYYQAQVQSGRVIGAEALVRWHHPSKGFVSPAQFIPLAEESALILPLGAWILRTACECLVRWSRNPALAKLTLAVNISPRQFAQADFVDGVLGVIAQTGINPKRLELELTESMLLHDIESTIDKMTQLKSCGVNFSLDDFGTGYSSLSYLKRLPLDQLKIDQSFVRDVLVDPNDAAIARTIIALGTSLGLRVIAEGVETKAQCDFLERHGCNTWQGYFFSRPITANAFETLIQTA
ncbi:bifunctional diguanylate cyclase/phosphodiesterase [Comamonas flocculans]|uniref:EAL domain-containing protein n=1 Tax=Comamonas flocculans TaxID=2597701 RepID=A0A5B8RSW4_9BURK|nr:EAL domain-containing protein [Comamonas flocculans]QEA12203.1 EAL domain-containing protein [Comamonas flocculans]